MPLSVAGNAIFLMDTEQVPTTSSVTHPDICWFLPGVLATNLEAIASGQLFGASSNPSLRPVGRPQLLRLVWTQQNPPERHAGVSAWACVQGGPGAIRAARPVAQLQVAALADWLQGAASMYHYSVAVLLSLR